MHAQNAFLTLTYRDDALTLGNYRPTLVPRDLELFWKRLRKVVKTDVRYFACGEYGDTTHRPHYHACIFGYDFPDKKFYTTKNGNRLYDSDLLDSIWGHGHCTIGDVTFETASYVARYIMGKKLGDDSEYYNQEMIEPEFTRMSRRPAIGLRWLQKYHTDIFPHDKTVIRGGIKSSAPKYYLKKYAEIDAYQAELVKMVRADNAKQYMDSDESSGRRMRVRARLLARRLVERQRPGA